MSDLSEVFTAAADLLESDGWGTRMMRDDDGHRCAMGALHDAAEIVDPEWVTGAWSRALIVTQGSVEGGSVGRWNDAQNGPEAVIAKFRELAAAS